MSPSRHHARYRAIEAINGTTCVEYLDALDKRRDGRLVGRTTDGREVVYGAGYPVKIKEVSTGP
jgi:hypothetical protein